MVATLTDRERQVLAERFGVPLESPAVDAAARIPAAVDRARESVNTAELAAARAAGDHRPALEILSIPISSHRKGASMSARDPVREGITDEAQAKAQANALATFKRQYAEARVAAEDARERANRFRDAACVTCGHRTWDHMVNANHPHADGTAACKGFGHDATTGDPIHCPCQSFAPPWLDDGEWLPRFPQLPATPPAPGPEQSGPATSAPPYETKPPGGDPPQ